MSSGGFIEPLNRFRLKMDYSFLFVSQYKSVSFIVLKFPKTLIFYDYGNNIVGVVHGGYVSSFL